jgi:esterase/lipase
LEQAKIKREALPRGIGEGETAHVFRIAPMGPGCLIIPDLASPPGELRSLAQHVSARGMTTLGIDPYRGQGEVYWEDWYATVLPALDQLWRDCNQVFIIGKGVGAALALHAASELPIAGVCTIAAPLTRDGTYTGRESHTPDSAAVAHTALPALPVVTTSVREATAHLQERVHRELNQVTCPVLLVHPRSHPTLSAEDARYVLERLGTGHKRIEWVDQDTDSAGAPFWERIGQVTFSFFRNYIQ